MSIAMERFGSSERPSEFGGSQSVASPYTVQCRMCGFEPEDASRPPSRCPKCTSDSWEQFAFPRSLLVNTDRYTGGARL